MRFEMNQISEIHLDYLEEEFFVVLPQKINDGFLFGYKFGLASNAEGLVCLNISRIEKICQKTKYLKKYPDNIEKIPKGLKEVSECQNLDEVIAKALKFGSFIEVNLKTGEGLKGILREIDSEKNQVSLLTYDEYQSDFDGITYFPYKSIIDINILLNKPFISKD